MKTSAFILFFFAAYTAVVATEDEVEVTLDRNSRSDCVCCPENTKNMDDKTRRILCLPPPEDQLMINANCEENEKLDACIERLDGADDKDEDDNEIIAELRDIAVR